MSLYMYYDPDLYPYIEHNFIKDSECNLIVNFLEKNPRLFYAKNMNVDYWKDRTIDRRSIINREVRDILNDVSKRSKEIVMKLSLDKRELYPDTLDIVKWIDGDELIPHADRENESGHPHSTPWRDFAAMVYLNDNFEGGEIYWPKKGKEFRPRKGSFATFPGTLEFLHGVRNVTTGTRYTISSFFTYDKTKSIY